VVTAAEFGAASLAAMLEPLHGHERPRVGLPTGNTPLGLYSALRSAVESGAVDVSTWRPVAIDEYGGPRDHPCSNRTFFAAHWDTIPDAPPVLQFDPEAPDFGIPALERDFAENGPLTVAVLGVGLNGHVAFDEPGCTADCTVRRVELHPRSRESASPCWGSETPSWGLTLGLHELLGARKVIVLANGQSKATIVAVAINGAATPDIPASLARGTHATWVLDEAAASLLTTND
jgi:6-phosphogluconolactonase/glucosamine-6-phosphate isomerase/deaminase